MKRRKSGFSNQGPEYSAYTPVSVTDSRPQRLISTDAFLATHVNARKVLRLNMKLSDFLPLLLHATFRTLPLFICERKFYARTNYATVEINP